MPSRGAKATGSPANRINRKPVLQHAASHAKSIFSFLIFVFVAPLIS